eukprot:TRINITY_DN59232_c0_g1_i1.p2 TRINITY_DN59232_c0_g1~~TRINITY_DN59232_c0_g1_i1.p2  ORF type:complete len:102 (-),score=11.13 TRINITY_DN59232_c0_g1_i1:142-447(-)
MSIVAPAPEQQVMPETETESSARRERRAAMASCLSCGFDGCRCCDHVVFCRKTYYGAERQVPSCLLSGCYCFCLWACWAKCIHKVLAADHDEFECCPIAGH